MPASILLVEQQRLAGCPRRPGPACACGIELPRRAASGTRDCVDRAESSAVNVEPTPSVLSTGDAAAEQLGELAAERQAEAGALHAPLQRAVDLRELLEDALLILRRRCRCRCRRPRTRPRCRPARARAPTRTSPRSVNLSALEMKLRRICETFPRRCSSGGRSSGSSKTSATDSLTSSGRSMPRSAPNRCADVELDRPHVDLAGLDLGEVEQVVDQLRQRVGRLADERRPGAPARRSGRRRCARAAAATAPGSSSAACGTRGSCWRGSASSSRRRGAGGRPSRRARHRARPRRGWCPRARG